MGNILGEGINVAIHWRIGNLKKPTLATIGGSIYRNASYPYIGTLSIHRNTIHTSEVHTSELRCMDGPYIGTLSIHRRMVHTLELRCMDIFLRCMDMFKRSHILEESVGSNVSSELSCLRFVYLVLVSLRCIAQRGCFIKRGFCSTNVIGKKQ